MELIYQRREHKLSHRTSFPLIAAPMFLISNPEMVIQSCKNGIIGSFPALNQRTNQGFEKWLEEISNSLNDKDAPYAVNLIVNPSNPRLEDDVKSCIKFKVPIIITSLGISPDLIKAIHSYGGVVLHDVINIRHAKKAIDNGVDGIIAVCAGAGGHAGTLNPFAFLGEIRQIFDGLVVLAGSMSNGSDILAAQIMGADMVYMGTRFINAEESSADADYKDMMIESRAQDITYTSAVSGVAANFLAKSLLKAGFSQGEIKSTSYDTTKLKTIDDEAKAWKTIWSAGQGVGSTQDIKPISDLINEIKSEYQNAINALK